MGERGLGIKSEGNKQNWEESDFPIVCTTCLGSNKYLRMMKTNFDRACRVCDRPFTVFRWRPSIKERFKKTEICQVCAKTKHVCQSCINDIETGQALHERDNEISLDNKFGAPKDIVNRDYWAYVNSEKVAEQKEKEKTKAKVE
jgi:pre-mRNA-splicing factor RBM22/SLT11